MMMKEWGFLKILTQMYFYVVFIYYSKFIDVKLCLMMHVFSQIVFKL